MEKKPKVTIYYDGECPICHKFVHFVSIKKRYSLSLIDMRENPHTVQDFDARGIDLDNGFVIEHDAVFLQGEEAFTYLDTILSSDRAIFHQLFHFVVRRKILRKNAYRIALFLRNTILKVQGRQPLHTNHTTMKSKSCGSCFSIVHFVFGVTVALMGLSKLLSLREGTDMVVWVGDSALSLIGLGGAAAGLALTLGIIAGVIELVGGISFAAKCPLSSKYSAIALSVVLTIAVLVHIFIGAGGPSAINAFSDAPGVFPKIMAFMTSIQLPLLYMAVFTGYAIKKCCRSKCCPAGSCEAPVETK